VHNGRPLLGVRAPVPRLAWPGVKDASHPTAAYTASGATAAGRRCACSATGMPRLGAGGQLGPLRRHAGRRGQGGGPIPAVPPPKTRTSFAPRSVRKGGGVGSAPRNLGGRRRGGSSAGVGCPAVTRAPPVVLLSSLLVASVRSPRARNSGVPPCRRPFETGGSDLGRAPEPDPRGAVARSPLDASERKSADGISSMA